MDEIIEVVNTYKNYQIYITIVSILVNFICIVFSLQMPFFIKYPNFYVLDKSSSNNTYILQQYTENICDKSKYIIKKDPKTSIHNWAYEYDIYCDRDIYGYLMTNAIFIGALVGTIVFTPIPDKYGREKIFKIFVLISLFLHINILFALGPIHLIIILFIAGMSLFLSTLFVTIVSELLEPKYKGTVIGLGNAGYSLAGIEFGFFFMIINEWKYYYIYATISLSLFTYYTLKYLYESPRWLHSMEKREECLQTLDKIAIYNNCEKEWKNYKFNNPQIIYTIGKKDSESINQVNNNKHNYSIYEILLLKSQRKNIICCIILCFISSYCYFGIVLTLDTMKGGFFENSIWLYSGFNRKKSNYIMEYFYWNFSILFLLYIK